MEPVSPELVLVDPELARVARARLVTSTEIAQLRSLAEAAMSAPVRRNRVRALANRLRPRFAFLLLALSVAANGMLGTLVARADETRHPTPAPKTRVVRTQALRPTHRVAAEIVTRVRRSQPRVRRVVVRHVVVVRQHALPRRMVNDRTGLPKKNLQIVCRRRGSAPFRCVLKLGSEPGPRGIVHYRFRRRPRPRAHLRDLGTP